MFPSPRQIVFRIVSSQTALLSDTKFRSRPDQTPNRLCFWQATPSFRDEPPDYTQWAYPKCV